MVRGCEMEMGECCAGLKQPQGGRGNHPSKVQHGSEASLQTDPNATQTAGFLGARLEISASPLSV